MSLSCHLIPPVLERLESSAGPGNGYCPLGEIQWGYMPEEIQSDHELEETRGPCARVQMYNKYCITVTEKEFTQK